MRVMEHRMTSVFVLFVLIFTSQGPRASQLVFDTMEHCKTAQMEITQEVISNGWTKGSIDCTEHKVGTFS